MSPSHSQSPSASVSPSSSVSPSVSPSSSVSPSVSPSHSTSPSSSASPSSSTPQPEVEFDGRNLTDANGATLTTWVDSSGHGRDATGSGAGLTVQTGVLNGNPVARWSGGAANQANFSGNASADNFTVIAVMKCTDAGTRTILAEGVGGDGPPRFYIDSSKITFQEDDNGVIGTGSTTLSTSTFYTVAMTYNDSTGAWAFYLNGSSDGSGTSIHDITKRFSRIGCRSGNQDSFKGDIAYVAYWNSVLTSADLTTGGGGQTDLLRTVWGHY